MHLDGGLTGEEIRSCGWVRSTDEPCLTALYWYLLGSQIDNMI
jgi:hypothetical protein